jgi:hypothetical protein
MQERLSRLRNTEAKLCALESDLEGRLLKHERYLRRFLDRLWCHSS